MSCGKYTTLWKTPYFDNLKLGNFIELFKTNVSDGLVGLATIVAAKWRIPIWVELICILTCKVFPNNVRSAYILKS